MYPTFTCSCRVEISTWNKHVFCSDVFISVSADSILLWKHFLVHRLNKRNTKNTTWIFKGTAISAITLHACIFCYPNPNLILPTAMFVFVNLSPEGVVRYTPTPVLSFELQESCKTYIIHISMQTLWILVKKKFKKPNLLNIFWIIKCLIYRK